MLDIKFIRENLKLVKAGCKKKNISCDLDELIRTDDQRRAILQEVEEYRARQNQANKEISSARGSEKEDKIAAMQKVAQELKAHEAALQEIEERFYALMKTVPNVPAEDVPVGKDEHSNLLLKKWGDTPRFDFDPKNHIELGLALDLMDFERGAKVAGSRAYYLKGLGMQLERAVLQFALDKIIEKGFSPMSVPLMVRESAMYGTGFFPWGEEDTYKMEKDDLYLIGTSEVPVTSYHMDEILSEAELPKYYAGLSPCFRREAGSYGKDTKGLYRIHQFMKVEQVVICHPDKSAEEHEHILQNAEEILQALKLPYRVMLMCGGDMGAPQVKKYDIETWMPSRKSYGETHSCSRFHDFQARRLNIRYKDTAGKNQFVHTLNNTVVATPRILIPLLEHYQQADGSIRVPEVLQPYMNGIEVIRAK